MQRQATDFHHPDPSKLRLILCAERLFAERGIEAVSLREIAAAAGQGNNNAVQYHFGSRQGLVLALTGYRMAQLDAPRRKMLDAAERSGRLQDVVTLFEIQCLPQVDLVDKRGRHPYAHFMAEFIGRYRPKGGAHSSDFATDSAIGVRRLVRLIAKAISHVPSEYITGRIELANLMFQNMLVRCDNSGLVRRDPARFRQVVQDTIEIAAAAASAPFAASDTPCASVDDWMARVGSGRAGQANPPFSR